jgi:spore germination protein KA
MSLSLFKKNNRNHSGSPDQRQQNWEDATSEIPINTCMSTNVDWIMKRLGDSTDLMIRRFQIGERQSYSAAALFLEGISDANKLLEALAAAMRDQTVQESDVPPVDWEALIQRLILPAGSVKKADNMTAVLQALLFGDTVFLIDGLNYALLGGSRKLEDRGIEEPSNEPVVRGPRDGFNETLRTNISLIRRRIKDPNLWMETLQIGRSTQTDVSFLYMNGIASPKVIDEVRKRLKAIDIDSVLESGYIEEFIQDKTFTLFPLVYTTERPDVVAAELLEGRVAILVDGTPFVLIAPAMLIQFLQASEDHYQRWDFATFIRLIRYASLGITLLAPALYIAITTFHQEVLPTQLLMSLAAAREGVPFPAFVEAVLMEITFEILREAGVRMPKTIGQAVSIVGTLVIGQAAVEAGLVSPAMVIVVAITAISNFVLPSYSIAISFRMLRFLMMILAATLGVFGILLGLFLMVFHLCGLVSFGLPYMNGIAPFHLNDQKDVILRVPRWAMFTRPSYNKNSNFTRVGSDEDPSIDKKSEEGSNS